MKRLFGFLMLVGYVAFVVGCDSQDKVQNYQFFKDHPDQALSVIGECRLNGTRGMNKDRNAVCDAANAAYQSSKFEASGGER